ncbi:response regulator [Leifsonia aquatica]|uniref:response regulator n=1 Tax=Leifsonia aquatica TaxID=144185 RepID=UPI003810D754
MDNVPAVVAELADQPTGHRVLVVDDDRTVSEVVCTYLRAAGFVVEQAFDGVAAVDAAARLRPDLVVLDRMLPELDGLEACRIIRSTFGIAVIMLTALGDADDRIDGLEAGADDYVAKPFSPRELVLRAQSVLRRHTGEASDSPIVLGDFSVDTAGRTIKHGSTVLTLTLREFDLLAFLITHPHQVYSRDELLSSVWGWEFGDLSTVTVHVRRLREKIEADPAHPRLLSTVWGLGYRFDLPERAAHE